MKVRRVLIYEGPERWLNLVLANSAVKANGSHNKAWFSNLDGLPPREIREISCEDITETDAIKKERE